MDGGSTDRGRSLGAGTEGGGEGRFSLHSMAAAANHDFLMGEQGPEQTEGGRLEKSHRSL